MKVRPDHRAHARHQVDVQKAGLKKAARQFEALFVEKLLTQMRSSVGDSGLLGKGPGSGIYDGMIDSAVADHIAEGQGMGIADFLYRQWTGERLQPSRTSAGAAITSPTSIEAPASATSPVSAPVIASPERVRDDGETPLRDLMPPTGLEKDHLFLKPTDGGPDGHDEQPSVGLSPAAAGEDHGRETQLYDSQGEGGGRSRALAGIAAAGRLAAVDAYRRHAGVYGGHERDLEPAGAREE